MPIVSSSIVEDRVQRDGRRSVRERHVDHAGETQEVAYLAEADADVNVMMAARVPVLDALAIEHELSANEAEVLA